MSRGHGQRPRRRDAVKGNCQHATVLDVLSLRLAEEELRRPQAAMGNGTRRARVTSAARRERTALRPPSRTRHAARRRARVHGGGRRRRGGPRRLERPALRAGDQVQAAREAQIPAARQGLRRAQHRPVRGPEGGRDGQLGRRLLHGGVGRRLGRRQDRHHRLPHRRDRVSEARVPDGQGSAARRRPRPPACATGSRAHARAHASRRLSGTRRRR